MKSAAGIFPSHLIEMLFDSDFHRFLILPNECKRVTCVQLELANSYPLSNIRVNLPVKDNTVYQDYARAKGLNSHNVCLLEGIVVDAIPIGKTSHYYRRIPVSLNCGGVASKIIHALQEASDTIETGHYPNYLKFNGNNKIAVEDHDDVSPVLVALTSNHHFTSSLQHRVSSLTQLGRIASIDSKLAKSFYKSEEQKGAFSNGFNIGTVGSATLRRLALGARKTKAIPHDVQSLMRATAYEFGVISKDDLYEDQAAAKLWEKANGK